MGKLKVLIVDGVHPECGRLLSNEYEVVEGELSENEILKEVVECDALIVRGKTKVNREIIDAGKKLKVIGRAGVGLDNIDVEYAEKKGIRVLNAPDTTTESVAELTICLIISLARHIIPAHISISNGKWEKRLFEGMEIGGKTLGIIGLGRIGQSVGEKATALRMNVIAYSLHTAYTGLKKVELIELLEKSDFVSLHTHYRGRAIISEKEIAIMKPTAYIINTARGELIDESALYNALKNRRIAGAAIDVYPVEPPDTPLRNLKNVILLPHIGASTSDAQGRAAIDIANKLGEFLKSWGRGTESNK